MRRSPFSRSRFRPPACIVVATVAMIVVMCAPAGDGPDDPPPAPGPTTLADAVTATRAVERARVELQTTMAGPSGPVVLVHRGEFVDGGLRARAESDMSQVAAALEAAGQGLDGDWSQPTGVVVDGEMVYSQLGPMAEALGRSADDWTRARLVDVAGADVDNDALALALDPLGALDLLRRPVIEIAVVGPDTVRGVATDHLRASLDLGAGGDASDDPPAGSFEGRLVAAGLTSLPVDVWVDAGGVVRRLVVSLGAAGSMTTAFDVYDVGAPVDVTAPDPADVLDPADVADLGDGVEAATDAGTNGDGGPGGSAGSRPGA